MRVFGREVRWPFGEKVKAVAVDLAEATGLKRTAMDDYVPMTAAEWKKLDYQIESGRRLKAATGGSYGFDNPQQAAVFYQAEVRAARAAGYPDIAKEKLESAVLYRQMLVRRARGPYVPYGSEPKGLAGLEARVAHIQREAAKTPGYPRLGAEDVVAAKTALRSISGNVDWWYSFSDDFTVRMRGADEVGRATTPLHDLVARGGAAAEVGSVIADTYLPKEYSKPRGYVEPEKRVHTWDLKLLEAARVSASTSAGDKARQVFGVHTSGVTLEALAGAKAAPKAGAGMRMG